MWGLGPAEGVPPLAVKKSRFACRCSAPPTLTLHKQLILRLHLGGNGKAKRLLKRSRRKRTSCMHNRKPADPAVGSEPPELSKAMRTTGSDVSPAGLINPASNLSENL